VLAIFIVWLMLGERTSKSE